MSQDPVQSGTVMMPFSNSEATLVALAHAIQAQSDMLGLHSRQVSEHIERNSRMMEDVAKDLRGLGERVARLEEQRHGAEIERLTRTVAEMGREIRGDLRSMDARMLKVEQTEQRRVGAKSLVDWLAKVGPVLLAAAVGVLVALGFVRQS